jgi:crotonobetainyl-CoA:carnitine CoA-transferase CaiB-like acyl-CoA transferase
MNQALSHLRVIEIGYNVSAPYATKLLADLGADVIKVEDAGTGDPLRSTGSFPDDATDPTVGALFRYLNGNKRSVTFDLVGGNDIDGLLKIISGADIVIENLGAGVLEGIGVDPNRLKTANPNVVLVRISDFGQDGPCSNIPATDLTVQAASGWVSRHFSKTPDPVQVGGQISDYVTGVHAACAALTAFRTVSQLGQSVVVDLSKQECLLSGLSQPALDYETKQALGLPTEDNVVFPVPGIVPCKTGYVGINILTPQHFEDFCTMVGLPEYISLQDTLMYPGPDLEKFYHDLDPWLKEHSTEEIVERLQAFRIPAAPVSDGRMLPELAQLKARSFYTKDLKGRFVQPGFPWRMEATPAALMNQAPAKGEHNDEILKSVWRKEKGVRENGTAPPPADDHLPFKGLRVLDLGIMWAGPYVGCYLGALGADVIKVESIQRPDLFRYINAYPQLGNDWYEHGYFFQGTNLNKRDLTLNLNEAEGKKIFERLVARADVVIENFSPRVLGNLGFSPQRLRQLNSKLIIIRMPGFGLEGPWRDYLGWAVAIEQASGMASVTGMPEAAPLNPGGFVDPAASMHALVALLAALDYRERTGEAQMIEVAQFEVGACMTAEQVIAYSLTGKVLERVGNRSKTMSIQGVYPCADGERVAISIRDDTDWKNFTEAMGSPDWGESEHCASLEGRQKHHDDLDRQIIEWTASLDAEKVVDLVRGKGVPVSEVLRGRKMHGDHHLVARKFYQEISHPRSGTRRYPGWPMRWSIGPERSHRFGAPTLGQHNSEILSEELGLSTAEIDELAGKKIIGTVPVGLS